jgi:uncharacterized protein
VALLLGGCVVLGTGVALLLTADAGSDGFSTLVNGVALGADLPFFVANLAVSAVFIALAAARRVRPGIGTVVQILVVGLIADRLLHLLETPGSVLGQALLLVAALPVLSVGIALYLGAQLGAGPVEAAGLAWDPPVPFKWSYSAAQLVGAIVGWLLGATIGPGTIVVILLLGPAIDMTSRWLRLDVHQRMEP